MLYYSKFTSLLSVSIGGVISCTALSVYRGEETFYSRMLMPLIIRYVDPEVAHEVCLFFTKHKLIRCQKNLTIQQAMKLKTEVFNMSFNNPIGVAAGFDKNCEALPGLPYYGLGFAEVGTVTPKPQDGNPKKRIFRLIEDEALINRCGFNNKGINHVVNQLSKYRSDEKMLIGLNLGKNKNTQHPSSDYLIGLEKSNHLNNVHYIVINISSPNTPGLRDLQDKQSLEMLLDDIMKKMESLSIKKPLLLKIAPDLSDDKLTDIADVILKKECVSGVILANTTVTRPDNISTDEVGGLSGRPLNNLSTEIISKFYKLTDGKIPIIGVGGVFSGQDAYNKIKAGASLVQIYTSLTYNGPPVVEKIKRELVEILEQDNLESISDAVGLDHKNHRKKAI